MREVLPLVYMDHHKSTGEAKSLWGEDSRVKRQEVIDDLFKINGTPVQGLLDYSTNGITVQGVDFGENIDAKYLLNTDNRSAKLTKKYGTAYVLENAPIDNNMKNRIDLVTVASACCNKGHYDTGSMTRTLDPDAVRFTDARDDSIKVALRAFFDICVQQEKTHVQVPAVGTGIYDNRQRQSDSAERAFSGLLTDVLNEEVGPNGEKRYQYFEGIYRTSF